MAFKKIKQFVKGVADWLRPLRSILSDKAGELPFTKRMQLLFSKMKRKQRLVVMDAENYREHWSFRLSALNLFVGIGVVGILLMIITFLLIAFTPLHNIIPGYTNGDMIEQTYHNVTVLDSIETKVQYQEDMMAVLSSIVAGKEIVDTAENNGVDGEKVVGVADKRSKADSLLREEIEQDRLESKSTNLNEKKQPANSGQLFFPPTKGKILSSYDAKGGHLGVDVAGNINDIIKAAAPGTVVFAGFTVDDGYVVAVQHPGNIITMYKHNSALLKHNGDMVRAGEPIAYMGHSAGAGTPHLHFELWINGKTVDPLSYISF